MTAYSNAPHGRTYSVVPHSPNSGSSGTDTSSTSDATAGLDPKVAQAIKEAADVIREED